MIRDWDTYEKIQGVPGTTLLFGRDGDEEGKEQQG
jgi:hypothetical protein